MRVRAGATSWLLGVTIGFVAVVLWSSASGALATPAADPGEAATRAASVVAATAEEPVVVRFFYGEECPYCHLQAEELDRWESQLPVEVHRYEVWHDEGNRELFAQLAAAYGVEANAVPATFIGPWVWIGFNGDLAADMRTAVAACADRGCDDPMAQLDDRTDDEIAADQPDDAPAAEGPTPSSSVRVPFVGTVELAGSGVVASTALIAFVDGFNPCSLWVLSILLALLVRTGSRARLLSVGGTFLGVTALVYGLFIAGAFGTLAYMSHLGWIRGVVATFALVFAVVSIKDYLRLKQGPSFTIPDAAKPRIYRGSRRIADLELGLPAVLGATVVMAAGVALVELPCTAGFPVVWSQILHDAGVAGGRFVGLLGLYLGIYLLDEVAALAAVVVTMRVTKVQERHVQVLKLVGGTIMLALGGVILFAPDLLHDLTGTLVVFLSAIAVAVLVHTTRKLVTR